MGKTRRDRFQAGAVTGYTDSGGLSTIGYVYDTLNCWRVVRAFPRKGPVEIRFRFCVVMVIAKPETRARRECRRLNREWREEMGLK